MAEGSIPAEPLRGAQPVQPERGELHRTSKINIFAIDDKVTKTHEDHVTKQGFGYSSPLAKPEVSESTHYRWEGELHPNAAERVSRPDYVSSSNVRDSIEALAENFAQNYRDRQDPVLQQRGEASYSLQFQPTQEQIDELMKTNPDVARVVRGLKPEEQETFMNAFRKANKVAAGKK
ncbi:hypothetical protein A2W24_06085 [Microgenomates group bacterium RBG_16_45_19]|nr:MAG: hypothetical protein A2W24_06085 [Microgenomates group bacterium RBG_16_45_19]